MTTLCHTVLAIDWGSVPDWGGAVGTVGAVIFTLRSASAASRQRILDEKTRAQSSARAIIINLGEILNDLMGLRAAFLANVGLIHVVDKNGQEEEVEFFKTGLGTSALTAFTPEERQLDLLEKNPILSGRYRLALRRHSAHLAAIAEYANAIREMKELREEIKAIKSKAGQPVHGQQENLMLRAYNVRSLGNEVSSSISEDIKDTAELSDHMSAFIRPLFDSESYPHIDTDALRKNPIFPTP